MPASNGQTSLRIFQEQLLEIASEYFEDETIPPEIVSAFNTVPRHLFVPRFLAPDGKKWIQLNTNNFIEHLPLLYANHPLCIHRNEQGLADSTISQPSLVLLMLDLLDLRPGQTVFELGAGSGWNAALMGKLVGDDGRIYSLEIIDDLVSAANKAIRALNIENVSIFSGNGADGFPDQAPFDRGVFTAAADSLPSCFFRQIKEGGLLLLVLKIDERYDMLTVLRKRGQSFESEYHFKCNFVPVTGASEKNGEAINNLASPQWIASGKPDIEDLHFKIHPIDAPPKENARQWLIPRQDAILEWTPQAQSHS